MHDVKTIGYIAVCLLVIGSHATFAQQDTSYYVSYDRQLTGRFYFSRKFTALRLKNPANYDILYRPNTTLNMGVGATYKSFTLNLAYGFPFLNPDRGQGKTRYLDLQFHSYGKKIILDVFGQFYRGFYLSRHSGVDIADDQYLRPDLRINELGTAVHYVFNHNHFSYRASFFQNEWQKKSAGTFLAGFEAYGGWVKADSSIIPSNIGHEQFRSDLSKFNFFEFGPSGGYAYTLILDRHFFFTASGSVSLAYGVNTMRGGGSMHQVTGLSPNTIFRIFAGYNSSTWAFNINYITDGVRLAKNNGRQISLNTGNFRVNLVHRFRPGRKARKILKVVDDAEKAIDVK